MKFGVPELLIVFAIILLVFGAARLPTLGASLGKSIKAFRKSVGADDAKPATRTRKRAASESTPRTPKP